MVQNESTAAVEQSAGDNGKQNAVEMSANAKVPPTPIPPEKILEPIPQGYYTLASIDVDTTGRRLIDEIVQLAAYTPNDSFGQYIMPYMNLNPAARQRHQVRVVSIGFYRMLKSTENFKIIRSKSEITALKDFLVWLEALKAKDAYSQGIVLVYHEERKFIPYMVLTSLLKYELVDRFFRTVKAFVNGINLARLLYPEFRNVSLRRMSRICNVEMPVGNNGDTSTSSDPSSMSRDKDNADNDGGRRDRRGRREYRNNEYYSRPDGSALVRAKMTYDVAKVIASALLQQSANGDKVVSSTNSSKMLQTLQPYAQKIEVELKELQVQKEILDRQSTFRPIFLDYFKSALYLRVRAVRYRIVLSEHGYDLQKLNEIWQLKKKDGLTEVLDEIKELRAMDKLELAELFDSYFDPNKIMNKPPYRGRYRRSNSNGRRITGRSQQMTTRIEDSNKAKVNNSKKMSVELGAGGDKSAMGTAANAQAAAADSTVKHSAENANNGNGKRERDNRNRRSVRGGRSRNNNNVNNNGNNNKTRPLQQRRSGELNKRSTRSAMTNTPPLAGVATVTSVAVVAN